MEQSRGKKPPQITSSRENSEKSFTLRVREPAVGLEMPPQLPPEPATAERARMRHLSGAELRTASPLRLPEEPVRHQSDAEGGKNQPRVSAACCTPSSHRMWPAPGCVGAGSAGLLLLVAAPSARRTSGKRRSRAWESHSNAKPAKFCAPDACGGDKPFIKASLQAAPSLGGLTSASMWLCCWLRAGSGHGIGEKRAWEGGKGPVQLI